LTLSELVDEYVLYRSICSNSAYQLRHSVALFESHLRCVGDVKHLTDRDVSLFLAATANRLGQRSVANHRTNLLCLWRFAADRQLVTAPNRVRQVTRPDPCPIAWTLDELQRILQRCEQLRGTFPRDVPRALYCTTLVRFCYDSGLRRSDVWRVERVQIRPDGSIVLRQHKTRRTHTPRIRQDTLAGFNRLPGDPPLRCPFGSTGDWYEFWREEVIKPAGVRHGALQQIRRTGASWLAVDHPEAVQRYLGHRTMGMQRHYVDESIARPQQFLPPEIMQTTSECGLPDSISQKV
jgi:integrase